MINFFKNSNNQVLVSYLLMISAVLLILSFKIVPAILAAMLAYVLSEKFLNTLHVKIPNSKMKEKIVGIVVGFGSLGFIYLLLMGVIGLLKGENLNDLLTTLSQTLDDLKIMLPYEVAKYIPESVSEIKKSILDSLKNNINSFAIFGKSALHEFVLIIIGWLIGVLIACKKKSKDQTEFTKSWNQIWTNFTSAFKFVVFAQFKVAIFNSVIVSIFLFVISPIFDWDIPYSKTLVLITFLCGMLPIVGNLISNTVTFFLALTVSLPAAVTALGLLMLIHKLEYIIISSSLGSDIDSDIWELLIVLFLFEILFGLGAMVFSPIIYAFAKSELRKINWIK